MAIQTRKANPNKPVRIMIYGVEGVGKSTLGAKSDKPVFITPEGGADQLTDSEGNPIEEMPHVDTWESLKKSIQQLITDDHDFKTIVLDSADWMEGLAHKQIIGKSGKTIITANGGYGSGYRQSQNMHQELIELLNEARDRRHMNIVLTAHAHVKPVKDPGLSEDYDAFEIKCHELVSSLWREWVDGLFFARFKNMIHKEDDKSRVVSDGSRVIYTSKQPAFQAKNRYGMPSEVPFTTDFWKGLMKYAKKGLQPEAKETAGDIQSECIGLIEKISDLAMQKAVMTSVEKASDNIEELNRIRTKLKSATGAKTT